MIQENIDFEPHKLARTTDPDTSKAAAQSVESMRHPQFQHILRALHTPRTAHEISLYTDLTMVQVARRLPEMESNGWVEKTDERRTNPSGRKAVVWRTT